MLGSDCLGSVEVGAEGVGLRRGGNSKRVPKYNVPPASMQIEELKKKQRGERGEGDLYRPQGILCGGRYSRHEFPPLKTTPSRGTSLTPKL